MYSVEDTALSYRVDFDIDDLCGDERDVESPEIIGFLRPGQYRREIWRRNDLIDRHDGPAVTLRNDDGRIVMKEFFRDGRRHRDDDLPAIECYREDGTLLGLEWYAHDELHREGAPAAQKFDEFGRLRQEWWAINNVSHRIGGPAKYRLENGVVQVESWLQHGRLHRDDGPAYVYRCPDTGRTLDSEFWRYGEQTAGRSPLSTPEVSM